MAAAAAAVIGSRKSTSRPPVLLTTEDRARLRAEVEAQTRRNKYQKLLEKYDADQSGKLNKEQMMKLLTDLETSTPGGHPPTDEEVEWIIKYADTSGSWLGSSDGEINATELEAAVVAYLTYVDNRELLDRTFATYDRSKTGKLDKSELKAYLTCLNSDQPVSDDEVAWVLEMADVNGSGDLNKPETMMATLEWFTYVETGKMEKKKSGSCCSLM
mmetsp:Transcript_2318/g.5185  ORF Transcript_2318/g.5185 Transcript_2318/m.5185 type:complete len:215 (-) Transcript_2318:73-717(-)